jgi:hypothetical protein
MSALGLQTLSSKKRGVIRLRPAFFERFGPRMSEINRDTRDSYFFFQARRLTSNALIGYAACIKL